MDIGTIVLICLSAVILLVLIVLLVKKPKQSNADINLLNEQAKMLDVNKQENKRDLQNMIELIRQINNSQLDLIKVYNSSVVEKIGDLTNATQKDLGIMVERLSELIKTNEQKMDKLIVTTAESIDKMQTSNEKKLEEMRVTVDEKLNSTLQDRLDKSFTMVSKQLEAVSSGLGEMKSLANGVGDLKKVLTNVKTRGTFGEVQLGTLLEQMLSPNQFSGQVAVNLDTTERVDYVVYLPGKDDKNLLLPIDAKFPMEDYLRLVEAQEKNDTDEITASKKALDRAIKVQAKTICAKYINVPTTTDFAIMYLPTEGLYSEVLRKTGTVEELQRDYKIMVCGPTTLSALLNSLQMGFKTLAIEKRSAEIWDMLSMFKKEFSTYVELLTKTQKKLSEASDTIDSATKKSEKIQKQLLKVGGIGDDGTEPPLLNGND